MNVVAVMLFAPAIFPWLLTFDMPNQKYAYRVSLNINPKLPNSVTIRAMNDWKKPEWSARND